MSIADSVRHLTWRLGRKLYCAARGDLANDPVRNGEYWLLDRVFEGLTDGAVMFDVGANVGDWTSRALELSRTSRHFARVFSFEPSSGTRALLQHRLADAANVEVVPLALCDSEGEGNFFGRGIGSGTNSLNAVSGEFVERVPLGTVDRFMRARDVARVSMMKIDTEGFDLNVLRGAEQAMREGRIDLIQFEYNWRWLLNRASLLQVFELVEGMPYRFGKLVGRSIVWFTQWHYELDRYFENNYVLARRGSGFDRLGRMAAFDGSNVAVHIGPVQ